jgi:hypothetical protein
LPIEQETQEIARLNRFDFGTQALDGVTMYSRQQAALAPLLADLVKSTAHRESFGLERRQRDLDGRICEAH